MAPKAKAKKEEVKTPAKGKKVAEEVKTPAKGKKPADGKGKKEIVIKATKGRGRVAGMRNEITEKDAKEVQNQFTAIESQFDDMVANIGVFIEKSNKSAAKDIRTNCQNLVKMLKPFRATVQQAKTNMKQVSVK